MNIPEEFGKYLLLKKLAEDALGETFRAGKVGKDAIEQVVLLRVFNGRGVDGERLWQKVESRTGVQAALRSPNIGTGVDLGRVRSFPYAAYDYVSGKSLATVLAQARKMRIPIPADHALLIAERIAVALAAAYETRFEDERILHGFVVPHLVMVSNEGETRMLGFEAAPGLRELVAGGWRDEAIAPYLAPEAAGGGALGKNDDVYSLGAILFELLTGERPPQGAEAAGVIERATLGGDVAPLPPAIVALLKRSLAPRGERLADSVTWHKTLSKLMIEGHYSPTTFNLAFFMHSLFRDEIEKETQELQAEKKLELPSRPAPPAAAPIPVPPVSAFPAATAPISTSPGPMREGSLAGAAVAAREPKSGSKAGLWLGLAALLVLVGAGAGWYFMMGPGANPSPPAVASPTPTPEPLSSPAEVATTPAGPTPEEIQAQIQEMFDAQSREMESKLKSQYDDRIRQLQQQLEDSRRATAEQQRAPAERPQAPAQEPPQVARAETPAPPPVTTPTPAPVPARPEPEPEKPTQIAAATPPPAVPSPTPRPQPTVQYGDLVQMGPGVVPPKVVAKAEPRYPPSAARLKRAAQVDVKVLVDERGRVMDAERTSAKAGFGFDEAAEDAARRSTFQAATKNGVRVKMWYTLRFHFKPRE